MDEVREAVRSAVTAVVEVEPLFVAIHPDGAEILGGISRSSMYELVGKGEIESVRVAGRRLIPLDALRAFAARVRAEQADPKPAA